MIYVNSQAGKVDCVFLTFGLVIAVFETKFYFLFGGLYVVSARV